MLFFWRGDGGAGLTAQERRGTGQARYTRARKVWEVVGGRGWWAGRSFGQATQPDRGAVSMTNPARR